MRYLYRRLLGAIFSLLLAFAAINLKADQTIGGTALNTLAPAFAVVLSWAIQGQGNTTINLPTWTRITETTLGINVLPEFWHNLIFKNGFLYHLRWCYYKYNKIYLIIIFYKTF